MEDGMSGGFTGWLNGVIYGCLGQSFFYQRSWGKVGLGEWVEEGEGEEVGKWKRGREEAG